MLVTPAGTARPMSRILVIEDDDVTALELVAELERHGMQADRVADGREGLERAMDSRYEAITLDLMLPGMDGLAVVTRLREQGINTPVLMISALSDVDERVRGLRAGGDDYLTKPFAADEMLARVDVLLRRQRPTATPAAVLRIADLQLDLVRHVAKRGERELCLLPTEYRLLEFLMRHVGSVLTRAMILEAVWGFHFDPGTNVIDVHIGRLRRKIDIAGHPPLIHTVRGTGYRLAPAD